MTVTAGGRTQFQDVIGVNGYLSQGDTRAHFGLGTAEKVDLVAGAVARRHDRRVEGREGGPGAARRAGEEVAVRRAPLLALGLAALAAVTAVPVALRAQAVKQPVYVGARACAECHEGKAAGNQYSHWLTTAHSKAWASLATPEAKAMARLSGIPDEPEKAPVCLGCHATAADAEKWERDAGFRLEDGVQCEKCHGPGSEYMDEAVMRDPEAARRAGLRRFTKRDCAVCHYVKGSHVAVHRKPALDVDEAWEALAHPVPPGARPRTGPAAPPRRRPRPGPKYVGVVACGACHQGPGMGYQLSLWRMSPHAQAYAVLSTPRAAEIAKKAGVLEDPQLSPACLKCHATGGGPGAPVAKTLRPQGGRRLRVVPRRRAASTCPRPSCGTRRVALAGGPAAGHREDLPRLPRERAREAVLVRGGEGEDRAPDPAGVRDRRGRQAHGARGLGHRGPGDPVRHGRLEGREGASSSELEVQYKNPVNLAFRPDGREVWAACEASGSVVVVDAAKRVKVAEIPVGGQATDLVFSPDGTKAYVTSRLNDSVVVIDVATRQGRCATCRSPTSRTGSRSTPRGQTLFVMGTAFDAVSVVDVATGKETKRLAASRNPWSAALSPDGKRLAGHERALALRASSARAPVSEVTVLDVAGQRVEDRWVVPESNLLLGVAWHPSGEFALATLNRTKNLVPMTRILQGWTITNGLAVLWKDGRVDQVLLDEPQRYFADITDVAFTPDGKKAFATSAGTDRVAVIDVEKLLALVRRTSDEDRRDVLPELARRLGRVRCPPASR